jgi:glycosyltransferase involved in cell wall biosynthesis
MKFSIITPTFNQLDWLRLCIASVRDQVPLPATSSPLPATLSLEHIIQDAGTTGIEDLARELGAEFHRNGQLIFEGNPSVLSSQSSAIGRNAALKIFSEPDAGMYDAVNRGLARATGDFCAYLNSDEQYLEYTLQKVLGKFAGNPQMHVLFMDAIIVDAQGEYICDRKVMKPTRLHTLVSGNLSVFTSSTFVRRQVFSEQGFLFDTKWKDVGDAEWVLRLIKAKIEMGVCNLPASTFTDTGTNMNLGKNALAEKKAFRQSAPKWASIFSSAIVWNYRIRRALAGLYRLSPHSYSIYTQASPNKRVKFNVRSPSFVWPGRFG